jgi:large subunit ribosomal protein L23
MKVFDVFKKKKKVVSAPKPKEEKVEVKKEEVKPKIKKEETGQAYRILIRPLVTEKISFLGQNNQYAFEVMPKANKIEIAKAFKNVYGIKPMSVNVMKIRGKKIRYGKTSGRTKNRKKAIITLKPGDKIEVYEGV